LFSDHFLAKDIEVEERDHLPGYPNLLNPSPFKDIVFEIKKEEIVLDDVYQPGMYE
jgi:hypothetical protein